MAHYVNVIGDRPRRTTAPLPSLAGDFSIAGWLYTVGTGAGFGYAISVLGGTGQGWFLDFGLNNWEMFIEDEQGGIWSAGALGTLAANTWYHVAITKTAAALTGHRRALAATVYTSASSGAPDSFSINSFTIGGDERYGNTSNYRQLRLFGWKIWQGLALSTDQLMQESLKVLPVQWSSIWDVYPLFDNTGQGLVGGNALTTGGTTVQDGPPISWGAPIWVVQSPAGAGGINGTAAVTLDALISAAEGTLTLLAAAASTLDAVTVSAAATLAISGQASLALEDLSSSATAVVPILASGTGAAADVTSAASATLLLSAQSAGTLDAIGGNAAGTSSLAAQAAATLEDVTATAAGSSTLVGSGTRTLADVTSAASATLLLSG